MYSFKWTPINIVLMLLFGYLLFRSTTIGISFYVLLFSILVYIFTMWTSMFDRMAMYIFGFASSYALLSYIESNTFNPHYAVYLLAPNAFYFWGKYVIKCSNSKMTIINFILFVLIFFALNTYILTIRDIIDVGLVNPYRGMLRTGDTEVVMPATLFGLNVSLGLAGLAIFLSHLRTVRKTLSYLFLIVLVFSLMTTIHLINRTGIIVFIACTLIVYLYNFSSKKSVMGYIIGILLFVFIVYLLFSNYIDGGSEALEAYATRETVEDGSLSDFGNRGWRWIDALQKIFTRPLGWSGTVPYNYAHNLWLDVAMLCGIIPFMFLMFATVRSIKQLFILRNIKKDTVVAAFIALYVCFFLTSFVEPVMVGFDVYFYLFCMLWGMQQYYPQKFRQLQ